MKIIYRTPKIIDVFLDDDVNPKHGWGRWSKFHIHKVKGEVKLILLAGDSMANADFQQLIKEVK